MSRLEKRRRKRMQTGSGWAFSRTTPSRTRRCVPVHFPVQVSLKHLPQKRFTCMTIPPEKTFCKGIPDGRSPPHTRSIKEMPPFAKLPASGQDGVPPVGAEQAMRDIHKILSVCILNLATPSYSSGVVLPWRRIFRPLVKARTRKGGSLTNLSTSTRL